MHRQNLGEMLVAANLIDEVQMQVALAAQKQNGKRFGSTLVELKFIDENVLAAFLSKQIDVPCISLLHIEIPKNVKRKMTRAVALDCKAIPVRVDGNNLEVAMVDPTDVDAIIRLEKAIGMTVSPLVAPQSSIEEMIDKCYPADFEADDTQNARAKAAKPKTSANDPVFWDLIADLDSGDLDQRLTRIEQSLEQIWALLEKVLRTLEIREGAGRPER